MIAVETTVNNVNDLPSVDCSFTTDNSESSALQSANHECSRGVALQEAGKHEQALKFLANALDYYQAVLQEDEYEADDESFMESRQLALVGEARVLCYMGESYRATGKNLQALTCFKDALRKYESINEKSDMGDTPERSYHLGLGFEANEAYDEAETHYAEALELYRDSDDTDASCQSRTAMCLQRLGFVYEAKGALVKAKACFEEAYALYRKTFPDQLDHPHLIDAKNSFERVNRTIEDVKLLAQSQNVTVAVPVPVQNPAPVASRPASPSCCGFFGGGKAQQIESSVANPMNANGTYQPPIAR